MSDALLAAAVALADKRVCVLTGAGVSTDSGIPDYRGEETKKRARRPVRFSEYVASDAARRRYWARATLGWPRIRDAAPNATHAVVGRLVQSGRASGVITQNVDGLHQKGGAGVVVELHGALREAGCLRCDRRIDRELLHRELLAQNPRFSAEVLPASGAAPDGDVDLDNARFQGAVDEFVVVDCACGGPLKPSVVFFGENVAPATLARAWQVFDDSAALLVLGSSLEVFSGRRFVEAAARQNKPTVLITRGATRADDVVTVKVDAGVADSVVALYGP